MDLSLQIGVAVYHLAKLRMLKFDYRVFDKYINREDFELLEMDTDSNQFAVSEDSIYKLIKPHKRDECENDKYNYGKKGRIQNNNKDEKRILKPSELLKAWRSRPRAPGAPEVMTLAPLGIGRGLLKSSTHRWTGQHGLRHPTTPPGEGGVTRV